MICPRCGRMNDDHVDYCTHCGASMGVKARRTGSMQPIEDGPELQTEVLTEYYDDYLDTVVEPVMSFDPSLFAGATQANASTPTWTPAQQPSLSPKPAWSNAATTSGAQMKATPAWTSQQTAAYGQASTPSSDEATWVLGAPAGASVDTTDDLRGQRYTAPSQAGNYAQPASASYGAAQMPQANVSYGAAQMPQANSYSNNAPTSAPAPAPAPAPTPASVSWRTPSRPSPYQPYEEKKEVNPIIIGLIIGLAVIVVVAATVAVLTFFGPNDSTKSSSTTSNSGNAAAVVPAPTESSSSSSKDDYTSTSTKEDEKSDESQKVTTDPVPYDNRPKKTGMTDADFYKLLVEAYDNAGDLDKRVAECASDFNANYLNESKQLRSTKAATASNLKARIKLDWDDLKNLKSKGLPIWSKNQEAYEQLLECYECLWHRIDVIDRAWNVSMQYDTKDELAKHESDILAPIKAQKGSDGNDKYFVRFKELYPTIKLVKP